MSSQTPHTSRPPIHDDTMTTPELSALNVQVRELTHNHDTLIGLVTNLELTKAWIPDTTAFQRSRYDPETLIREFLYKFARGFSTAELAYHLADNSGAYGLAPGETPTQRMLSYYWKNVFSVKECSRIRKAALHIRFIHETR